MTPLEAALARWQRKIGSEIGCSDWVEVTQGMIDQFADSTQDHQWIHVDPARAADTPFKGTIAHGFLTLSLGSRFSYEVFPEEPGQTMGINYGLDRIRFLAPVRCGAWLRGRFVLKDMQARKAGELLRRVELTVEIRDQDTPALVADWLGLVLFNTN